MVDYTSQTSNEPARMALIIDQVDVAAKTCSGTGLKNNNPLAGIRLDAQHGRWIDWPRQGEHWAITAMNGSWYLDYKLAYGNDGFQKEAGPGDSVLVTTGTVLIEGGAVRLNDANESDIIASLRAQSAVLRTAAFGGATRTRAPYLEIQLATDYSLPAPDVLIPAANWYGPVDTDSGWLGQTYQVPVTGKYRAEFTAVMVSATTGYMVAWLSKNGGVGAVGAVYLQQDNVYMGVANTQAMPKPRYTGTFNAGDVIYFGTRGTAGTVINAASGQSHTRFTMTWIGP
jgi:hypothetical protein